MFCHNLPIIKHSYRMNHDVFACEVHWMRNILPKAIPPFRVPSTVKFDHLEEFLKLQLVLAGRPPPSLGKDVLRALGHLRDSAVLAAA